MMMMMMYDRHVCTSPVLSIHVQLCSIVCVENDVNSLIVLHLLGAGRYYIGYICRHMLDCPT